MALAVLLEVLGAGQVGRAGPVRLAKHDDLRALGHPDYRHAELVELGERVVHRIEVPAGLVHDVGALAERLEDPLVQRLGIDLRLRVVEDVDVST